MTAAHAILCLALVGITPAEAYAHAIDDLATIPAEQHGQMRYLVLPGGTTEQLAKQRAAVSLLVNSVSRTRSIVVPQTIAGGQMLRLDLAAYHDFRQPEQYAELFKAWERLAERDPYWHIRTQIADRKTGKLSEVTTDGGWVNLDYAAKLKQLTGSFGAVLRADYFVARVGAEAYHEWAGIPETEAELYALFGVDIGKVSALSADTTANMIRSGITRKARRIIVRPGAHGPVITTKDIERESPDRDPFRSPVNFAEQQFKHDAAEIFALGANGLWRYAVYDGQGKRQETVPAEVAVDYTGDGIIRSGVSCMRCHELNGGSNGLQPFRDDQTDLLRTAGASSYLPEVAQRVAEAYDPARFGRAMARGREDYAAAVATATGGMSAKEATALLAEMFAGYRDSQVSLEQAAAEVGLDREGFIEVASRSNDPIILMLRYGRSVQRSQWEASYHLAALAAEAGRSKP